MENVNPNTSVHRLLLLHCQQEEYLKAPGPPAKCSVCSLFLQTFFSTITMKKISHIPFLKMSLP